MTAESQGELLRLCAATMKLGHAQPALHQPSAVSEFERRHHQRSVADDRFDCRVAASAGDASVRVDATNVAVRVFEWDSARAVVLRSRALKDVRPCIGGVRRRSRLGSASRGRCALDVRFVAVSGWWVAGSEFVHTHASMMLGLIASRVRLPPPPPPLGPRSTWSER